MAQHHNTITLYVKTYACSVIFLCLRPVSEANSEAPEHQAKEEADTACQAQNQPGVEWDDDARAPQRAIDQV